MAAVMVAHQPRLPACKSEPWINTYQEDTRRDDRQLCRECGKRMGKANCAGLLGSNNGSQGSEFESDFPYLTDEAIQGHPDLSNTTGVFSTENMLNAISYKNHGFTRNDLSNQSSDCCCDSPLTQTNPENTNLKQLHENLKHDLKSVTTSKVLANSRGPGSKSCEGHVHCTCDLADVLSALCDSYDLQLSSAQISRLLVVEPEKRISSKDALAHPFFKREEREREERKFYPRRLFKAAVITVIAMNKIRLLRLNPPPISLDNVRRDPYGIKTFRKIIDAGAFKIYGHWVKRGENQNRAALFENTPKSELKIHER